MSRVIKYGLLVVLVICLVFSFYWSSIYEGYEDTSIAKSGTSKSPNPAVRTSSAYGSNGVAINGYDGDGKAILSFDKTGRPIVGYNGADPIIGKPQQEKKKIPQLVNISAITGFNKDGTPIFSISAPSTGATLSTMNGQFPDRYTWSKDVNGTCAGGFITLDGTSCTNVCETSYDNGSQCVSQPDYSTNNTNYVIGTPETNDTYKGTPGCNKQKGTVCSYKDSKCVDQYGISCDIPCCSTASTNVAQTNTNVSQANTNVLQANTNIVQGRQSTDVVRTFNF
jgi:hypothetical protein